MTKWTCLLALLVLAAPACGRIRYRPGEAGAPDADTSEFDADVPSDVRISPDAFTAGLDADSPADAFVLPDAFAPADTFVLPDAFAPPDAFVLDAPPVNECLVANGGCSMRATCADLPLGRSCTCNAPYVGDGLSCSLPTTPLEVPVRGQTSYAGATFGWDFALSRDGNTLVVHAVGNGALLEGLYIIAHLYRRDVDGWRFISTIRTVGNGGLPNYALSGDGTLVAMGVGSNVSVEGEVRLYRFNGVSSWVSAGTVRAPSGQAGDYFGSTVALNDAGNVLVAGAFGEDSSGSGVNPPVDEGAADSGAAYVFRDTGVWSLEARLKASRATASDEFGFAVAINGTGDVVAASAHYERSSALLVNGTDDNVGATVTGAAYVFRRVGSAWAEEAYVKASSAESVQFGHAIALDAAGQTLAVTAPLTGPFLMSGRVYVYSFSAGWSFAAELVTPNPSDQQFGGSVAMSSNGSRILVGALRESSGSAAAFDSAMPQSGAAYRFDRSGAEWRFTSFLKSPRPEMGAGFGYRGAITDAGEAFVSAPREDGSSTGVGGAPGPGNDGSGALYIFR